MRNFFMIFDRFYYNLNLEFINVSYIVICVFKVNGVTYHKKLSLLQAAILPYELRDRFHLINVSNLDFLPIEVLKSTTKIWTKPQCPNNCGPL